MFCLKNKHNIIYLKIAASIINLKDLSRWFCTRNELQGPSEHVMNINLEFKYPTSASPKAPAVGAKLCNSGQLRTFCTVYLKILARNISRPGVFRASLILQKGSSLMEVLVSLAILGLGIGGVLATQTMGLRSNQSAYFRTQADILLGDIGERMRNNASQARAGGYVIEWSSELAAASNCGQSQCNAKQMSQYDLSEWISNVGHSLPKGEGKISTLSSGAYLIEIRWQDKGSGVDAKNACAADVQGLFCMAVTVQI